MKKGSNHSMKKIGIVVAIIAVILLVWFIMHMVLKKTKQEEVDNNTSPTQAIEVAATVVGNEPFSEYITLNGVTKFLKTATIRSHVTGYISNLKYGMNSYIK